MAPLYRGIMQKVSHEVICDSARRVLDEVTRGLSVGDGRTVSEPSGIHMALRVLRLDDRCAGHRFAVGHYHESAEGRWRTLVGDPEVELLWRPPHDWFPLSLRTPFAFVVTADVGDTLRVLHPIEQERLVKLVDVWMANVKMNLLRSDGLAEEMRGVATYAAE